MKARRLDFALGVCVVALSASATYRWHRAIPRIADQTLSVPPAVVIRDVSHRDTNAAAITLLASRIPFGIEFGDASDSMASTPGERASPSMAPRTSTGRPALALRAIVGGPPWSAVLDGLPGESAGTLVVVGSTFAGFRVISISRDTVVIRSTDTTWSLTMRRGGG